MSEESGSSLQGRGVDAPSSPISEVFGSSLQSRGVDPATLPISEDFDHLKALADPLIFQNAKLFMDLGRQCQKAEEVHDGLSNLVHELRKKKIRLRDQSSLNLAKWYMKLHYDGQDATLEKYIGNLQKWLCVPSNLLPARITISSPVPNWITAGIEVAAIDPKNEWWHAVTLEVTKNKVKVYWVGYPPKHYAPRSRLKEDENPTLVDKGMLIAYEGNPGFDIKRGCDPDWLDVPNILQQFLPTPQTFHVIPVTSRSSSEPDSEDDDAMISPEAEAEANPKPAKAQLQQAQRSTGQPAPQPSKGLGLVKPDPRPVRRSRGSPAPQPTPPTSQVIPVNSGSSSESDSEDDDTVSPPVHIGAETSSEAEADNPKPAKAQFQQTQRSTGQPALQPSKGSGSVKPGTRPVRRSIGLPALRPGLPALRPERSSKKPRQFHEQENSLEVVGDDDGDEQETSSELDGDDGNVSDSHSDEQSSSSGNSHGNSESDTQEASVDDAAFSGNDDRIPLYDIHEVFNIVDAAIETLESLDAGIPVHDVLYDDLASKLTFVASFLANMYSNNAYKDLVVGTLEELRAYAGQQEPRRFRSKAFLNGLSKYGFCISPRMWKKEEILCIAISILDIRLDFQGINQKDGKDDKTSFRGMAVLNARIQRIFYKRLHHYGFVNPRYHPERLQSFSSVVINGGGSWQQSATWEFCTQSCFRIDTTADPFIVRVASDVGALECAGVYVASTTKKNGKPVYVQVSKKEFNGFAGQKGFRTCLKHDWIHNISSSTMNNEGKRVDACSPRVLVCLNADQSEWGIQLLPGYCSDLCIMKFAWSQGQISNIQRFASFDFNTFKARMQPCALSITTLCHSAVECLNDDCLQNGHVLSFGTSKILKSCFKKVKDALSFQASPLGPQGWHSDGPRVYNDSVFDTFGNIRPDAAACANRGKWTGRWTSLWNNPLRSYFSDHIGILQESFSALFGIFKGTFIETPPVPINPDAGRHQSALKVHVPLGCAVVFTFAWKHRGKGDDPEFRVTPHRPVPVHARPHFYAYSSDIRKLPSVDCETSLEFISICSQTVISKGSQSQLLDCLQTFDRSSAPGHWDDQDVHDLFRNQQELDAFVQSQLIEQNATEERVETATECRSWNLLLDSSNKVQLRFIDGNRANVCVTITSANFDSVMPSFRDSSDQLYNIIGKPAPITSFPDESTSCCFHFGSPGYNSILKAANQANEALLEYWCESSLLHLLSILNVYAISDCTLTIRQATAKDQSGHKYVLSLEGSYCRDSSTFQNVLVRPDCEGVVAELYRECLRQLVSGMRRWSYESINAALASLELSIGVFNVGVETLVSALEKNEEQSPSSLVTNAAVTYNSVFTLGTRCVIMAHTVQLVYKISRTKQNDKQQETKRTRSPPASETRSPPASENRAQPAPQQGLGLDPVDRFSWRQVPINDAWINRSDAWARVEIKQVDRLPRMPGTQFPVNQYCEDCEDDNLCQEHGKLMTKDVDFTQLHMQAMNASGYCLVECGGGGDCFYHSMMFLARLHDCSELVTKWKDHASFRKTTCKQLKDPKFQPRFNADPRSGEFVSFLEIINRDRHGTIKPQTDAKILRYYLASQKKSKTRKCNGTYVQTEMIQAVAFQNNIIITVADRTTPRYHVVMPNGQYADLDDANAVDSPFFLWCTGGHYQAFVKIDQFEILATALERPAFKESCLLYANDFRAFNEYPQ